jgi:hypothetical protein
LRAGVVWLASLLVFPIAGAPLLAHPAFRRWGLAARFAVAAGAGCFAVTTTMLFWTLARASWSLPFLVAAGFLECLGLRLALGRRAAVAELRQPEVAPWSTGERLAAICIVVSVLAAAAATFAASATSTDLLLFWGPKSAAFAAARGVDAEYLADHLHRYQHASYPPLVPNVFAFATLASGGLSWMSAAATFPLLLALLGIALPGLLRRFATRWDALAASAVIVASVALCGHVYQMAGNADLFLLFFEILGLAVLLGAAKDDRAAHVAAALLLGGATAAKVEGLPFTACTVALYVMLRGPFGATWRRSTGMAFGLIAPSAIALFAWLDFGRRRAIFLGYESYGPTLDVHWSTVGHVLATIGASLGGVALGLAWLVPLAACIASRFSRERLYLGAICAVLSLFFVFTYLHGPDPTAWIEWSAGRIFLVVSPLLAIAAITRGAWRSDVPERGARRTKAPLQREGSRG